MLPQWSDEYSVQNALIDEQHKKLFDLAATADKMIGKQTDSVEIKKVLIALFDYMKTHFSDEEAYMASIEYPMLEDHKEHHKEIIAQMVALIKNMKYDFKQKLAIITEQWLVRHILQEDMKVMHYRTEMEKQQAPISESCKDKTSEDNILEDSLISSLSFFEKKKGEGGSEKFHIYTCRCGRTYNVIPKIHQQILQGRRIGCKRCHTHIVYINDI